MGGGRSARATPWARGHRALFCVWQGWTEPNSFHVCITSYKQLFRGHAAFSRVRWRCLVVDDMQRVKGLSERHWEAVFSLQRSGPRVSPIAARGPGGGPGAAGVRGLPCGLPSPPRLVAVVLGTRECSRQPWLRAGGRAAGPPLSVVTAPSTVFGAGGPVPALGVWAP